MKNICGQATIEYIIIFAFMTLVSIGLVRGLAIGVSETTKSLGWVLSQELSTGICQTKCLYTGYIGEVKD